MSIELKVLQMILVLFFTLFSLVYNSSSKLIPEGSAVFDDSGFTVLTNTTEHSFGRVFNNETLFIKNETFNFHFLFGIVPELDQQGSHGMAFVISPTMGVPGASSDQYLGLFNQTNNGKSSNHVIAIELDTHKDEEFGDIDDNHVGININGMKSVISASAGYYDDEDGRFHNLSLISRKVMRLSIVYSQSEKQLNVTLSPAEFSVPPEKPLLSLNQDLSPYFLEEMYFGFTASTGTVGSLHYMLGVSITPEVEHPLMDLTVVPTLPPYPKKSYDKIKRILAVCLTLAVIAALVASWIGSVFYWRHKKVKEVLEEWEIQYGPHRGTLPGSDAEIAVKRTSHDSRQGMSEFLAEISTIGRLRHPNLVRLLGIVGIKKISTWFMTLCLMEALTSIYRNNTNENQEGLTWEQRFKIIKNVASALLYLHQEWVQVIIHRDIKPANVLIDHEMNARLGDFGLAKLYDQGFDPQTSKVAGTFGRLIERREAKNEEILVDWILELWEKEKIFDAAEESIRQEQNRGQLELVLKLGLLCSQQAESIRPDMSAVMRILNGVLQLPDNLLEVVRAEKLRGQPEISMEVLLLDMNSVNTLTFTNSFLSHGR
ncbi:unnamed protein product [Microthlaspi erraticum]|uniref:non-specific serine/threonine protein kinase n=1 Tax=Microthlaspi erraticum TaxID=1685480 RepID=A0A6D2I1F8_9BRAS|nr:unnamed protein product [Microthlaspi erraticum]